MAKFDFSQDTLVTIWQRQHFTVEAETLEEAKEIVRSWDSPLLEDNEDDENVEIEETEYLYDTVGDEVLDKSINNGYPTIYTFCDEDSEEVLTN